ncbi:unnamed protein product [Enterobius vermicularis]|uniref:Uncharacterized protein n=1 Tax=Enterobius vermicularis TaxID=51028 RepID=A0A0N4UU46_ENTVE|nr:unnamed protein product [Enterobius vermicularis]
MAYVGAAGTSSAGEDGWQQRRIQEDTRDGLNVCTTEPSKVDVDEEELLEELIKVSL